VCLFEAGNTFSHVQKYYRESRKLENSINYKKKKTIWAGQIWRENCLLKHVTEGKIMVTRRRGGRYKHLLYDLKKKNTGNRKRRH